MAESFEQPTVSFTVNVGATDAPFVEKTLRHMLRSLRYPFIERLVALDTNRPTGVYAQRGHEGLNQVKIALARLLEEGLIDRVDEIAWSEGVIQKIIYKYFGHRQNTATYLRDYKGAPIYQYLYALEQCCGNYIFHADSDMLFFSRDAQSWIDEGIRWMQSNPKVVITTLGHPPRANGFFEYLIGRPLSLPSSTRWLQAAGVSTRYFLWDQRRIEQHLLPLIQNKVGDPLEKVLAYSLQHKGYIRCSLNSRDAWALHPMPHNENFVQHLDDLIWAVEHNVYPFRRHGRYPWNLYTYDRPLRVWLKKIQQVKGK